MASWVTAETSGRSLTLNVWVNSQGANSSNIGWSIVGSGSAGGYVRCGGMYLSIGGNVVLDTPHDEANRISVYVGTVCYSGNITLNHDTNGNLSVFCSLGASILYYAENSYASGTLYPPRIGLAPTGITVGHDTVTSNSVRVNTEITSFGHGTSAATRIYYRAYPSGGWVNTTDQNDVAGPNYFTITGLSPYQAYEYKAYWWNNNGDANYSSVGSFTTLGYANYTNGTPYCETIKSNALNIAVCVDVTCDSLAVATDGGGWVYYNADFVGWKVVTISGLSPGVQHSFKTSVKRKDSQLWKESSTFYGTTLAHATITSATGNINDTATSVTISFTNPTGTQADVWLELPDLNQNGYARINNVTSPVTLTIDTSTKNSILSAMTSVKSTKLRYVVHDALDGVNTYSTLDYTITIVDANPTFTNFTYLDTNSTIVNKTGNDQYLVQNLSTLRAVISSANKAVALKGATILRYTYNINGINLEQSYSTSTINKDFGVITAASNQVLAITAYDSRGNLTTVTKTVLMVPYSAPVIKATAIRLNGFEADTTINLEGTISPVLVAGVSKNTIAEDAVQYRYKENDGAFGEWQVMERQMTDTVKLSTTEEYLSLANTSIFTFEFNAVDTFGSKTVTIIVDRGKPLFMISDNLKSIGIGKMPEGADTVDVDDDITMYAHVVARDHGSASSPQTVNVIYGTSTTPPSANDQTEGTIYVQYTA